VAIFFSGGFCKTIMSTWRGLTDEVAPSLSGGTQKVEPKMVESSYVDTLKDFKLIIGLLVLVLALNSGSFSFYRGLTNIVLFNLLLRKLLEYKEVDDYKVLRIGVWILSMGFFVGEPFLFDNKYAEGDGEMVGDVVMATGRMTLAVPGTVMGALGILIGGV